MPNPRIPGRIKGRTSAISVETSNPVNLLDNGDGLIRQRGELIDGSTSTYSNDDMNYGPDRWLLIQDGNDKADYDIGAAVTNQSRATIRLLATTTSATKFGIMQVLEASESRAYVNGDAGGRYLSLSFVTWAANSFDQFSYGILEWQGTADEPDTDASTDVWTWNAASTKPSPAGSWTFAQHPDATDAWTSTTGAIGTTAGSAVTYTLEDVVISSSATNIAVVIYADQATGSYTSGQAWAITNIMLNEGRSAVAYKHKTKQQELAACQRYYQKTFRLDQEPMQNVYANGSDTWGRHGALQCQATNVEGTGTSSVTSAKFEWNLNVPLRKEPTKEVTYTGSRITFGPSGANTIADSSSAFVTDFGSNPRRTVWVQGSTADDTHGGTQREWLSSAWAAGLITISAGGSTAVDDTPASCTLATPYGVTTYNPAAADDKAASNATAVDDLFALTEATETRLTWRWISSPSTTVEATFFMHADVSVDF